MKPFVGAIFDLDGTLLDSMDVWNEIDRIFLSRRGISVPEDYLQVVAPMGFRRAAEYTVERFGLPESVDALIEEWDALAIEAYQTRVRLKPGAREYLLQLKRQGVRLAVATASREAYFVPALKNNGIDRLPPIRFETARISRKNTTVSQADALPPPALPYIPADSNRRIPEDCGRLFR